MMMKIFTHSLTHSYVLYGMNENLKKMFLRIHGSEKFLLCALTLRVCIYMLRKTLSACKVIFSTVYF